MVYTKDRFDEYNGVEVYYLLLRQLRREIL